MSLLSSGLYWADAQTLRALKYHCGHCGSFVASDKGYKLADYGTRNGNQVGGSYICVGCNRPTFFDEHGDQHPAVKMGKEVESVPAGLGQLYEEARRSSAANCYTGAVLLCRKMLMNIAVDQGAKEGLTFAQYVDLLAKTGFVPPNGKDWVDQIRERGNDATHEIALMQRSDAEEIIGFVEMLLKFIYEFPSRVPKKP